VRIVTVPCLKDNFAYLVIDGSAAAVVDPSEAPPIDAVCEREGATLTAIWLTHHHWDHVGGVQSLRSSHPGIEVVAHGIDAAKLGHAVVTREVEQGSTVAIGTASATIVHNPGHTLGAISFHIAADDDQPGAIFTGDTLFGGGCGRIFEGTPEMMYSSLMKFSTLPSATRVYFGHEYTAANLAFAAVAEPNNSAIARRAVQLEIPSTPSTIELELATNPFLRAGGAEHFRELRSWKDRYR